MARFFPRNFLIGLIILNLFMGISAVVVDWSDFFEVPWYLIPFVPICPLYPLLLGINFFFLLRKIQLLQPLLFFTLMGTISYGFMAYIFYPTYLVTHGFAWYEFGNMAWVTLYAAQSILLFPFLKKISWRWLLIMTAYFLTKDFLDRFGETFSYHREEVFSTFVENIFFVGISFLHLATLLLLATRRHQQDFRAVLREQPAPLKDVEHASPGTVFGGP